jgi:hypothetical protein
VCGLGVETPYALVGDLVLTREHYREAGARMAAGVVAKLGLYSWRAFKLPSSAGGSGPNMGEEV